MNIFYTSESRNDLNEINDYISNVLSNPSAANNIINKILIKHTSTQ